MIYRVFVRLFSAALLYLLPAPFLRLCVYICIHKREGLDVSCGARQSRNWPEREREREKLNDFRVKGPGETFRRE